MKLKLICTLFLFVSFCNLHAQRSEFLLEKGWKFAKGDHPEAADKNFDDKNWESVVVPHDWAIYGPFDRKHDLQEVAVIQNNERVPTVKTGRTGGLPYMGVGWYRTYFNVDNFQSGKQIVTLKFDGAMSEARVYVNGKEVCFWPYGYNAFHCAVTEVLNADGKNNRCRFSTGNSPPLCRPEKLAERLLLKQRQKGFSRQKSL